MKYRAPTQLHASLYMKAKKNSADSKVCEEAKVGKSVSNKKTDSAKKQD